MRLIVPPSQRDGGQSFGEDEVLPLAPAPLWRPVGVATIAVILTLFGLTMLYSTSSGVVGTFYLQRQAMWAVVGVAGAVAVNLVGYRRLAGMSWLMVAVAAALLLAAYLFFPPVKGAYRWIRIPGGIGNIQPSEFAKLALVLLVGKLCSDKIRRLNEIDLTFRNGVPPIMVIGGASTLILGLILLGKDFGTTVLLGLVIATILFVAGLKLRYFLPVPGVLVAGYYWIRANDPTRWSRLVTYLDPESYQAAGGYQVWLSLLAIGSGGVGGIGFAESRLKAEYLPEAHTDFIMSIVGEELGFIAMTTVVAGYILLVLAALETSVNARTKTGMFVGVGLTAMIGMQAFINIGVVTALLPTKGMPAPFISYGGSNLVVCLLAVGIIVNIGLEASATSGGDMLARLKHRISPPRSPDSGGQPGGVRRI